MTLPTPSQLAAIVLILAAIWLVWIGMVMVFRPESALNLLRQTASSYKASLSEQIPRMIAGAALVVRAQEPKLPTAFEVGGWFIVASSLALLSIPLRWHSGYARWWADRLPNFGVQAVGPFSIAAGAGLTYASF